MQLHFFTIPIHDGTAAAAELNRFLATHKVADIERQFTQDGRNSAWSVCVAIDQGAGDQPANPGATGRRPRVDYKEVLNDEDFRVYSLLRALRKEIADAEGLPVYGVFNNEQLAAMVQGRVTTTTALAAIDRVGAARVENPRPQAAPHPRALFSRAGSTSSADGSGRAGPGPRAGR